MLRVAGVRPKHDVFKIYERVADVLGEDPDYLLAITLALYKAQNREKYGEKVVYALINEATRPLLVSVVDFFKKYRHVDKNAKVKVAQIMRCILDNI